MNREEQAPSYQGGAMSEMNDLQAWKEALEKHGLEGDLSHCLDSERLRLIFGERVVYLWPHHDDHDAAEFISRVTEFVFGQWAYYQSLAPAENDAIIWALMEPDDAGDLLVASGLTKLETLLNALQRKEAAS